MIIVVDTNVLLSALLKDAPTRRCLREVDAILAYPDRGVREFQKYKNLILEKSGLSLPEFAALAGSLFQRVAVVPSSRFLPFLAQAKGALGAIDPDDVVFIAAALSLGNAPVWSEDRHFRRQALVRVLRTKDITALLGEK